MQTSAEWVDRIKTKYQRSKHYNCYNAVWKLKKSLKVFKSKFLLCKRAFSFLCTVYKIYRCEFIQIKLCFILQSHIFWQLVFELSFHWTISLLFWSHSFWETSFSNQPVKIAFMKTIEEEDMVIKIAKVGIEIDLTDLPNGYKLKLFWSQILNFKMFTNFYLDFNFQKYGFLGWRSLSTYHTLTIGDVPMTFVTLTEVDISRRNF